LYQETSDKFLLTFAVPQITILNRIKLFFAISSPEFNADSHSRNQHKTT